MTGKRKATGARSASPAGDKAAKATATTGKHPRLRRFLKWAGITGLVLAAWSSSACTHWKVQSAFPEQVISRRPSKGAGDAER